MKTFYVQEPHLDGTTLYQPGDKREADENDVKHLVDLKVLGDKPPAKAKSTPKPKVAPDYERDGLATIDLSATDSSQLLAIAAFEGVDATQFGSDAELRDAIAAKRSAT